MKTEDLITLLAAGESKVDRGIAARRYALALGWGTCGALLLMAALLGMRADLADAAHLTMFWVKLAYVAGLAVASLLAAARLSRPGMPLAWTKGALAAPVLAMWLLALFVLWRADASARTALFFGQTWTSCPLLVAMLSVPIFAAVVWAMRGLAPTRLRLAGAAAGLLSGASGALVYCLHCPEMDAPFLGFWYLLGILIPTAFGALLGPRLLRW